MWQLDMKCVGMPLWLEVKGRGCHPIRGRDATLVVPLKEDISRPDKVKAHSFPKYIVRDTQIHWDYRQNQYQEPHPNQDGVVLLHISSSQWPFCLKRVLQQEKVGVLLNILMISRPRKIQRERWLQNRSASCVRKRPESKGPGPWGSAASASPVCQMPTEQPQACWGRDLSSLLVAFTLWKII